MDIRRKLAVLADAAKYDTSCASNGSRRKASAQGIGNWRTLPEAQDIAGLLREAPGRVEEMVRRGQAQRSAAPHLPSVKTLPVLREAVQGCTGCELCTAATQAVFGAGRADARLMLIGEQPGDREDRSGQPFCGPAGLLLSELCSEAGLSKQDLYLTNAVKHFRHRSHAPRPPARRAPRRPAALYALTP